MAVIRFRSVEDMPPPWRDPGDPGNLRMVALMMALHRRFAGVAPLPAHRVQRFRSLEELNASQSDPYRGGRPAAEP